MDLVLRSFTQSLNIEELVLWFDFCVSDLVPSFFYISMLQYYYTCVLCEAILCLVFFYSIYICTHVTIHVFLILYPAFLLTHTTYMCS